MAVNKSSGASSGRRLLISANTLIGVGLAIGIVVFAQIISFNSGKRWNMTSSSLNELTTGSTGMLEGLEQDVRLTSLYYETDIESEDQQKYRRMVDDLLQLYENANRSKITSDWVNPAKNRQDFEELVDRLSKNPSFAKEQEAYKTRVDAFTGESGLGVRLQAMLQKELQDIATHKVATNEAVEQAIGPVEIVLQQWVTELDKTIESINREISASPPMYTGAVEALKVLYRSLPQNLQQIQSHGVNSAQTLTGLSPEIARFLANSGSRYSPFVDEMSREQDSINELEPPSFDEVLSQINQTTSNAILVESNDAIEVVPFNECWPIVNAAPGQNAQISQRAFEGEAKVTAAVLRATLKERAAVVFVRYGGQPLTSGGAMSMFGGQRGDYVKFKQHLSDANFIVKEWDLKTSDTSPVIDPPPTRTIYVVFKPTPPQRGPMGQPGQDPPFTDKHRDLIVNAIGTNGRAFFIAGWSPGPFGGVPAPYEYNDYLEENWGIKVDTGTLMMQTASIGPGKFAPIRQDFGIDAISATNHDVVSGPQQRYMLNWAAPLRISESLPEGATVSPVLTTDETDTIWGVADIAKYQEQVVAQRYLTRIETDTTNSAILAAAGSRGEGKVVVVSSKDFATDRIAFDGGFVFTPNGALQAVLRNPGNVGLFVNSLHWLNDNTEFKNIGKPVEQSVLVVEGENTVLGVRVFAMIVWPALAMFGGIATWWVRRK